MRIDKTGLPTPNQYGKELDELKQIFTDLLPHFPELRQANTSQKVLAIVPKGLLPTDITRAQIMVGLREALRCQ